MLLVVTSLPNVLGIYGSPPVGLPVGSSFWVSQGISRSQPGVLPVASSFQVGEGILGVNLECS